MELNKAQAQAAKHKTGQMLVVAGAGTGKTRVIVQRISNLLDQGIEPSRILAVTFTEKAAAEMLERVLEMRPDLHAELPILTFNAFGEGILREFNTEIGLPRSFLLLGDSAQIVFLEQHLDELELEYYAPVTNPKGLLPDIADYFSKLKQNVITPADYAKFVKTMPIKDKSQRLDKTKHNELARAYGNYIELSKQYNVIDYDDQIYRAIELLKTRPNIQSLLQKRYQAVMIDEFQDTNPMQSQLIDLLAGQDNSLMVVGDDDQSIYGFRGATLANILDFKQRYPDSSEVTLIENYRSGQAILDAAYALVQFNNPHRLEAKLGIDKRLRAQAKGNAPVVKQFSRLDYEVQWLVDDITERLASGQAAGEIAVLCRRNVTAQLVGQALHYADIKYAIVGERYQLYKTEVVRMLVEGLRAIVDNTASLSLYHLLGSGLFNVSGASLAELAGQARSKQQSLEAYLRDQATDDKIQTALETITKWRDQASILPVGKLVYVILEDTGFKNALYGKAMKDAEAANTVMQLSEFFKTLKEFESIALQPTAAQYLESFPVLEAAGESSEDNTLQISPDQVNILTIHKAKGLEWDTVYVPDCTEGSFPLRARAGGITLPEKLAAKNVSAADEHIAEERRLMYVALTRAKNNLILSYSRSHNGRTTRKASRFIDETSATNAETDNDGQELPQSLELANSDAFIRTDVPLPSSMTSGQRLSLSVSQIETFLNCPLNFYYKYVLRVPDEPSPAAQYGQAVHAAIELINLSLREDKPLSLEEAETEVLEILDKAPHESKLLKERMQQQALATVKSFYQQHYLDSQDVPRDVELPFSAVLREEGLVIKGRIDAVFETDKGVEIRDYKTSTSVDTDEKAKRRASGSDQLTLYALVWQELYGELPKRLSLDFVDTAILGSVAKTQRGVDSMRAKLVDMVTAINKREFLPGKDHRFCRHPELD